jgi:hypothetical protein
MDHYQLTQGNEPATVYCHWVIDESSNLMVKGRMISSSFPDRFHLKNLPKRMAISMISLHKLAQPFLQLHNGWVKLLGVGNGCNKVNLLAQGRKGSVNIFSLKN